MDTTSDPAETQGLLHLDGVPKPKIIKPFKRPVSHRANDLDGATWTRNSISIWSDIRKTQEEFRLGHPALFPTALVTRLIQCFTTQEDKVILDPFAGAGSVPIAAEALGRHGIGIEISPQYVQKALKRPIVKGMLNDTDLCGQGKRVIYQADAKDLLDYVKLDCVDFVVTSPPYWDILLQRRTADYKTIRHYGDQPEDLGRLRDYHRFLEALQRIFGLVYQVLRSGKYCCIVVMDLRKKDRFYPFHMDIARLMQEIGFIFDDLIIWDRRHEYSNLRPLGYPSKFRINKTHEFVLIFQKPRAVK